MSWLPLTDPEPIDFRSRPLIGGARPQPWTRGALFALGLLIGLLLGLLA